MNDMWNNLSSIRVNRSEKDESVLVKVHLEEGEEGRILLEIEKQVATSRPNGTPEVDTEETLSLGGLTVEQLADVKGLLDSWLNSSSKSGISESLSGINGEYLKEERKPRFGRSRSGSGLMPEHTHSFDTVSLAVSKHSVTFQSQTPDGEYRSLNIPSSEEVNYGQPADFKNVVNLNETLFDFFDIEFSGDTSAVDIDQPVEGEMGTIQRVEHIFDRFDQVTLQLRDRQRGKPPLRMDDEYDVQYLLHALLRLHFDDVRDEEYLRRHANKTPRIDFLLEGEKVGIEVKRPSENHRPDKIRTGLAEDKEQYRSDARCNTLLCFIYDPEKLITNPVEFETAITESTPNLTTRVTITQ